MAPKIPTSFMDGPYGENQKRGGDMLTSLSIHFKISFFGTQLSINFVVLSVLISFFPRQATQCEASQSGVKLKAEFVLSK